MVMVEKGGEGGQKKNNKLGEKSLSAKLWKQIIRSLTTEHNNIVSGDGNAINEWDNVSVWTNLTYIQRLSQSLQHAGC